LSGQQKGPSVRMSGCELLSPPAQKGLIRGVPLSGVDPVCQGRSVMPQTPEAAGPRGLSSPGCAGAIEAPRVLATEPNRPVLSDHAGDPRPSEDERACLADCQPDYRTCASDCVLQCLCAAPMRGCDTIFERPRLGSGARGVETMRGGQRMEMRVEACPRARAVIRSC